MTPMQVRQAHDDDLEDRPRRGQVAKDGEVVRRSLLLMDGRSVVDHSAGRTVFRNVDGRTYVAPTDAERQALEDARLNHKRKLSNAWKKMRSARTDEAEEDALASVAAVQGTSAPVKPAFKPTGDAIEDARNAYHHRLEQAYLKTRPTQLFGSLVGDQS